MKVYDRDSIAESMATEYWEHYSKLRLRLPAHHAAALATLTVCVGKVQALTEMLTDVVNAADVELDKLREMKS